MKKLKKCDTGGGLEQLLPLLPTALGAINPALGIAANVGIQGLSSMKQEAPITPDTTYNTNPYGKMKTGGLLPAGFVQHNAKSHADGGQAVDSQGKPNMVAPVAEVQNKENVYNNYVYSDMLKNPKTGKTFNIDMQKLAKKYKNADTDLLSKTALNVSADNLAKTNDVVRSAVEQIQAATEQMPQAPYGIDLEPLPQLPINIVPGQVGYSQESNMNLPQIQNPFETMTGQDVQDPFDAYTKAPTYINKVMSNRFSSNAPVQASTLADAPADYSGITRTDDKSGITDTEGRGFNYNTAALVAKGLGFAGTIGNAMKPAENENLVLPDYNPADLSFDRASIDYTQAKQDVLGASNILGATNRNASSGFGQFRNREAARIAGVMDNIGNINMQERNANSQLDITRGQYRSGKAQDIANRTYQNNVDNLQNKAVNQQFKDQMFSELTQIGSSLNQHETFKQELANRKDIANMNLNQFTALAKARGLNFTYGEAEEFLNAVKSGQNPIKFTK
jgi:hypothetical protein